MHSKHTLLGIVASAVKCRSAVDASRILWQREIHIHDMVMPSDSFRQSLIPTSHKIFTRKKCCFVAVLRPVCLHCYRLSGTEAASCFCHCLQLDTAVTEPPHHCGGSSLASLVPLVGSTSGSYTPDRVRDGSLRVHWYSEQMANEPMFSKWFYRSMVQQSKKI